MNIYVPISALEVAICDSESVLHKILYKLPGDSVVYTDISDEQLMSRKSNPDEDLLSYLYQGRDTEVSSGLDAISQILVDNRRVLDDPTGIYILDIQEDQASSIQDSYGVVCCSSNRLDHCDKLFEFEAVLKLKEDEYQQRSDISKEPPENLPLLRNQQESTSEIGGNTRGWCVPDSTVKKDDETVFAALFSPASAQVDRWFRVQVHLYEMKDAEQACQKAKTIDKDAERMFYNPLSMKIQKGTIVQAELSFLDDGVWIDRRNQSLVWDGMLTSIIFMAKIRDSSMTCIAGNVLLSVGGVPVGSLYFSMDVSSSPDVDEKYKLGNGRVFEKVFISYAHEDVRTASAMASAYSAQGTTYFFDHHSLEAGSVFDEEIERNIEDSDLFLLLWSENAARSKYVEREYLHAMQYAYPQKERQFATLEFRPYFIDPVADPPDPLKSIYNFKMMEC